MPRSAAHFILPPTVCLSFLGLVFTMFCLSATHPIHRIKGGPGMVVHACNPSTQEAEAEGSIVKGQLGLQSETFS
jgi:hypothetical protein